MSPEIEIVEGAYQGKPCQVLYVNGGEKARLRVVNGEVQLTWLVHGPQSWEQGGRELLLGLLELGVMADALVVKGRKFSREEVA